MYDIRRLEKMLMESDLSIGRQQELLMYKREVCDYCPKRQCYDLEYLELCFVTYIKRSIE